MSAANDDQRTFWSDEAGPTWVARMQALDAAFAPVLDQMLRLADLRPDEQVLDIGCGAGTSTIAAAAAVAGGGSVCGVDISVPLLAAAQAQAEGLGNVRFERGDAQVHGFDATRYDCLISRFGLMFFDDFQAAFRNMARALAPGGRMVFATWGAIGDNPFFTLPAQVTKAVLGPTPKTDPDAPGPFALRDETLLHAILQGAGLEDIVITPQQLDLTPPGNARDLAEVWCDIGPAERGLQHFASGAEDRARLKSALVSALTPCQTDAGLRIPARINFCSARKPA